MKSLHEAEEHVRSAIGQYGEVLTAVVELDQIKNFAEATGDPNQLYVDPEYAQSTRWRGIVAPTTFLCRMHPMAAASHTGYGSVNLNGGNEYVWYLPLRPGDVIAAQAKITGVRVTHSKNGELLIVTRETTFKNQRDQVVALGKSTHLSPGLDRGET